MVSLFHSAPFRQIGDNTTVAASTTTASGALSRAADQTVVVH